jgi:hypothetical protein
VDADARSATQGSCMTVVLTEYIAKAGIPCDFSRLNLNATHHKGHYVPHEG